ncbi:MAG: DUF4876 domain-containing protein [Gemmatimonadota bacterium]
MPILVVFAAACGGATTVVDPPPPPAAGFTVLLAPVAEDQVAAQALGWTAGIPGADVTITPNDSSAAPRTVQSSGAGVADFGTLPAGAYIVEAKRWLTASELAKLPPGEDANGWIARAPLTATGQAGQRQIPISANRRKGLVISEWAFNTARLPPINHTYPYGGFLELYNNGDTTVYVDGLTIVQAMELEYDYPTFPCSVMGRWTNDRTGLWTRHIQQFPGRGHDHPVAPGAVVVIAIDAIDHSKIVSRGIDLSHADFEFWGGPGDVDNPAVPNMIDTLSVGYDLTGHGPVYDAGSGVVLALARPYNLAATPRSTATDGKEWAQVGADLIIDIVSLWAEAPYLDYPRCSQMVNSRFDVESSDVRDVDENIEYDYSVSRRALPSTNGRVLLQHSHSSGADFVHTLRSPRLVP